MSGFTTAAGVSVTQTSFTQQAPLGFQITVPTAVDGNAVYTYVFAANQIPLGIACAKDPSYAVTDVATSTMAMTRYIGIAQQPVGPGRPDGGLLPGEYGFVLTRGVGQAKVNSASATDAALVMHTANGELDVAAATAANTEVGVVNGPLIAAGAIGSVYVNFAG